MYCAYSSTFLIGQQKICKSWFEEVEEGSGAHTALGDAHALVLCSEVRKPVALGSVVSPKTGHNRLMRYLGYHCEVPVTEETAKDEIMKTISIENKNSWEAVKVRTLLKSCLTVTEESFHLPNYYLGGYKCREHNHVFYPVSYAVKRSTSEMKIVEALEGYRNTYSDRRDMELSKTSFLLYVRRLSLFDLLDILDEEWNNRLDYLIRYNITEEHYGNMRGDWSITDATTGTPKRVSIQRWREETGATKRIKLE